jgi:hypothetical protein
MACDVGDRGGIEIVFARVDGLQNITPPDSEINDLMFGELTSGFGA